MKLERLDLATARKILDFSGGDPNLEDLGELQLRGAVALHNMIADPEVGMGYLADEVGMGKTYIALGVVSLMRYFNPTLRVLYICPSANVQEKWYEREYINFARSNVKVSHFRVRTIDGSPAAPKISCRNVHELIHSASLGYFSDFFVRNNLFSINLSIDLDDEQDTWEGKLKELKNLLPAWWSIRRKKAKSKEDVKGQYAEALNYVLPTFDLVVIDEAHNFKHDFESSARNLVLSKMLGFRTDGNDTILQRVNHALLLSATPYDRDLEQLRNQLKMVGKDELLPEDLQSQGKEKIQEGLSRFMVRRFNTLKINHKKHTRNMYRHERRSGKGAEICLKSHEQKLITALVQKKVLELLKKVPENKKGAKKRASSSFQMGMLASFESYADSTKSGAVEYDSDSPEKDNQGAEDRHIIGAISNSYKDAQLGTTLPHPKMDEVSKQLDDIVFKEGKKHIVFVRRVKSVKELKHKLDDYYNQWIFAYLENSLEGELAWKDHPINKAISKYKEVSRDRDDNISGGEYQEGESDESISEGNNQPPNDTIFAWFFRGKTPKEAKECLGNFTPERLRKRLKDSQAARFLEINWASAICNRLGLDLDETCAKHGEEITALAQHYMGRDNNPLRQFHASQFGFLEWCKKKKHLPSIEKIINCFYPSASKEQESKLDVKNLDVKNVVDNLKTWTLFDAMREKGLLADLFPLLNVVLNEDTDTDLLRKLDILVHLLSMCLRRGHGFIDLYISWLRQGEEALDEDSGKAWITDFADRLKKQSQGKGFNTYQELSNLSQHLDLIIKTNLSDVHGTPREGYQGYFSRMLNLVVPVVGATGETSGRSAQARNFRMPGYPLILISTNVFQEGEDLHTFCDSVLHYGLSSSPVSIEQKIGRVDRVGSQAQRRLQELKTSPNKDQFIQVSFPFVRESIEALQVRQLCRNINEFIDSFDKDRQNTAKNDEVNIQNVSDTSKIPELTKKLLKSPYEPDDSKLEGECRAEDVKRQSEDAKRIEDNIDKLLKKHFDCKESVLKRDKVSLPRSNRELSVGLRSARASGEMLLRAKYATEEELPKDIAELRKSIIEKSWRTFHRVYVEKYCSFLNRDAEILIGDEGDTTFHEIEMFFERFLQEHEKHDPNEYKRPVSDHIIGYWKQANEARYGQWLAEIKPFENEQHLGLKFAFGDEKNQKKREHKVRIYEAADRCIFIAQVADAKITQELSKEQLVRFTWERNANIDIVEFMLDDKENLVGRAVHPIRGLDEKEFLYCAYTLAVEADRLEYLIGQSDEH